MEKQLSLGGVARAFSKRERNSTYISLPGSVVAYYPTDTPTPTADVQPMLTDPRVDLDTGAIIYEPWSVVQRVPVCFTRGGGFFVAVPLAAGDPVVLEAWDLDPTAWRAGGRSTKPADPADVRRHGGNYFRCVPADLAGPFTTTLGASAMVLGKDGDQAQIVISPGSIQLGATGGDAIALASKVDKFIQTVMGWTPAPNDGGAALKTALSGAGFSGTSTTKSTLIKAQ